VAPWLRCRRRLRPGTPTTWVHGLLLLGQQQTVHPCRWPGLGPGWRRVPTAGGSPPQPRESQEPQETGRPGRLAHAWPGVGAGTPPGLLRSPRRRLCAAPSVPSPVRALIPGRSGGASATGSLPQPGRVRPVVRPGAARSPTERQPQSEPRATVRVSPRRILGLIPPAAPSSPAGRAGAGAPARPFAANELDSASARGFQS